jgi:hypothetical protein
LACIVEQVLDVAVLTGNVSLADTSELVPDVSVLPDTVGLVDAAEHVADVLPEADNAEQVRDVALLTDSVAVPVERGEPGHIVAVQRSESHVR